MERVTEQHRQWGLLPYVQAAEAFVDPILRRLEVKDGQKKAKGDAHAVVPEAPADEQGFAEYAGTYDWDTKTDKVTPHDGSWMPEAQKQGPEETIRQCVRDLCKIPEYRAKLQKISALCGRHNTFVEYCGECRLREPAFHAVMWEAYKRFGDPTRPREKKLIIG